MNLFTQKRKTANTHLPPLANTARIYSIRKLPTNRYNKTRISNHEVQLAKSVSAKQLTSQSNHQSPYVLIKLSDLHLGKCIGRGKGGRVVLGSTPFKNYAVKIIPKEFAKYAIIEASILESVSSPFIVSIFAKLEDSESIYLVLEYIQGCDLFHYMRRQRLKLNKIVQIAAEVLMGLEALHNEGIVYRDLKPENIMINDQGNVKLIDFGLSKEIRSGRAMTVCGSAEYMAPEVIRRNAYGYAVDFWAFGVLLFELFCGHPPFQGDSYPEICENILGGNVEFTRSVDPLSKDLIRRLLNNDPACRLGNFINRIADVKHHKFFRDINWDDLSNGRY